LKILLQRWLTPAVPECRTRLLTATLQLTGEHPSYLWITQTDPHVAT
jgi:hypothetical protein